MVDFSTENTFLSNEIGTLVGSTRSSHNGIFRFKDLGTISNLNEYLAFRQAHGINDHTYKDLYLGDYFKIQDGTYNVEWMVAHFDYYMNKGNPHSEYGVVLIPKRVCGSSKMNNTNTTTGGYNASIANTTTCPSIASALQTVLGSYLLSTKILVSMEVTTNVDSMAGAGSTGASTGWVWVSSQCSLPNEVQIYGTTALSSSYYDIGEGTQKLAIFNFINHIEYSIANFWLRSVATSNSFAVGGSLGFAGVNNASESNVLRPLIYIG